jgi:hypothetical protein
METSEKQIGGSPMGIWREKRIAQDKQLKKLNAAVAAIDRMIADERRLAGENERAAAELAVDAINDRKKLTEQTGFYTKQNEHLRQVQNLEKQAAPIRADIAVAEEELSKYVVAEAHESVIEAIAELEPMTRQLSGMIEPVAIAFSEFKNKIDAAAKAALVLVSRGDEARTRALVSRLRTVLFRGMRAQIASDFHAHGVDFLTGEPFEAPTFAGVVSPALSWMVSALEIDIFANGTPTPGRRQFRCNTNVSGLFGLALKFGEVISLPVEDENVKKLVASGAVELIDTPTPEGTEEKS